MSSIGILWTQINFKIRNSVEPKYWKSHFLPCVYNEDLLKGKSMRQIKVGHVLWTLRTAESRTPLAMKVTSAALSATRVSPMTSECWPWACRTVYRPPCCSWVLLRNQVPGREADSSRENRASSPSDTSQPCSL